MKKPALLLVAILLVFSIAPASAEDCIDLYGSHAYVEVDVKQATCTEDGYVLRRCSRAGCSSEETVPFKKYGHSYDNGICIRCNAVEPAPVPTPTASPTTAPTATPTLAPTATPTLAPTATPTLAPTATPTLAPTATTTLAPTATPTLEPTATTTLAPTATPTLEPTATPTLAPTATPTLAPTATPTLVPKTTLNPTTAAPTPTPAIPSTETPVPFIPSLPPADTPVLPELLDPTPTPIATSAPTPAIQSTQTPLPFIPSLPPADTLIPLTPTPEPAATHSPTEVPIHPLSEDTPIPDPTETLSPTGIPSPTPKHFAPKTPNVTTQKDENIWDLEISFSLSDENERLLFLAKKIGPANQAADPADPYQYEATLSYLSGTAEPVLILQGRCWFSATVHGQREDNNPFRLTITRFPQLAITFEAPSVSASFLPDPDQDILLLLHILGFEDTGSPFLSIELSGTNYAP